MGKKMKRRIWSGDVCEQIVYVMPTGVKDPASYEPEKIRKERFKNETAYKKFEELLNALHHVANIFLTKSFFFHSCSFA